eukprot:GHUV01024691.1.p1 GENE.GHUV01024691.1~~GHUV01024691.1.p1  ORF type:complete len:188 (+),score=32.62 GHUV01024691.1:765-1328(+)
MISGLAITVGLVFSPVNVKLSAGLDQTACGLSTAMIGFFVNLFVTVTVGLVMQKRPGLFGQAFAAVREMMPSLEHINIGNTHCTLLNPYLGAGIIIVLLFTVPFYRVPLSPDFFVGDLSLWAFIALFLSGILAVMIAFAYMRMWTDWDEGSLVKSEKNVDVTAELPSEQELGKAAADVPASKAVAVK